MGRSNHRNRKARDKNKAKLPNTPKKDIASDGRDIEFSQELANGNDLEAQERSRAADARAKK